MKIKILFVAVLSFFWAELVHAQEEAFFTPENPTTMDVITVTAPFVAGPFVETQSHSIDGNEIHVIFVQDGLDFSPNPPHQATEVIWRLPAGRYTIFVELSFPGVYENTITLEMVVSEPHGIPTGNLLTSITLIALMLLIGIAAIRTRTPAGLLSLVLVFSFLPQADSRAEETNSLYVLLESGQNAPTPSEVVEGWNSSQSPLMLSAGATDPVAVRYLLPLRAEGDFALRLNANPDSPRAKLERMVVVEYPTTADRESAMNMLLADSQVETVSRTRKYELSSPNLTSAGSANYGWSAMNVGGAWQLAGGHALVGVADTGLKIDHPELRAFNGSGGFDRGGFLQALSLDIGRSSLQTIQVDSNVDERELEDILPRAAFINSCLRDPNDEGRVDFAGHGTHVASLIGGNAHDGNTTSGLCKNCGVGMWRIHCATRGLTGPVVATLNSDAVSAAVTFLGDIGAQVINLSLGSPSDGNDICASSGEDWEMALCTALEYVSEREIAVVGSSGNHRTYVQFPASDERVVAVGGVDEQFGFWDEHPGGTSNCPFSNETNPNRECGTNWTVDQSAPRQEIVAPARKVHSAMYHGFDWNPDIGCGDSFDTESGYGPCTGTSMSAPQVSGILGILRSVNPLVPVGNPWDSGVTGVRDVLASTTFQSQAGEPWDTKLGYGIPDARAAVRTMLGTVGGETVKNRVTPLFEFLSVATQDYAYTASPQTAIAFMINEVANYSPQGSLVPGYPAFPDESSLGPGDVPRTNVFVLTTEYKNHPNYPDLTPLFMLDRAQTNPPGCKFIGEGCNLENRDFLLATGVAELEALRTLGYEYRGIEGYVYERCSPELDCIPEGAQRLWRKCKTADDDCAIFLESERPKFEASGYTAAVPSGFPTHIGYAYPNVDTDSDGLIDGFEHLIGTDPTLADSDGDSTSTVNKDDGVEFPMAGVPVSDPCDGPLAHNNCRIDRIFANRFEAGPYVGPGMSASMPMSTAQACAEIDAQLTVYEQYLDEQSSTLDESDGEAWQQHLEEVAAVEEVRDGLDEYCE